MRRMENFNVMLKGDKYFYKKNKNAPAENIATNFLFTIQI